MTKNFFHYLFIGILILFECGNILYAQVGIGTIDPDQSAILDIQATSGDKGMLIPRVALTDLNDQAPIAETPAVSLLVYNTNTSTGEGFYYWSGTKWEKLTTHEDDIDTSLYKNNGTVSEDYRTINLDDHIFGYINNATDNAYLYLSPAGLNSNEFYWSSSTGHGFAVGTEEAFIIGADRMATFVAPSSPPTPTTGSLVIKHETADGSGVSSIVFPSASNRGSDYGYISYEDDGSTNGTTNENGLLTLGISNDGTGTSDNDRDNINIAATGSVGIGNKGPNQQASLDLGQNNKGLLINRVALSSTTSKGPIYGLQADLPESLLVYNTDRAGTAPNNVVPGFYFWTGSSWSKLRTGEEQNIYTTSGKISQDRTLDLDSHAFNISLGNAQLFRLNSSGSLKLNNYGGTAFMGNPNYLLGVNSTGDVIQTTPSSIYEANNKSWFKQQTSVPPSSINDNIYTNGKVAVGKNASYGALHLYEATGTVASTNGGSLTLEHGDNGGESSIVFRSAYNGSSDYAYLKYEEDGSLNGSTSENGLLTLGIENDGPGNVQDDISIAATGNIEFSLSRNRTYTMTSNALYPFTNREKDLGLNSNRWRNLYIDRLYYRLITQDSDRRLKDHISGLGKGLSDILKISTYKFNYKDDESNIEHYGFIAQELNDILPSLVSSINDNAEETLTVNITELIPVLVNAIKEQNELLQDQKTRIEALERAVSEIREQIPKQ